MFLHAPVRMSGSDAEMKLPARMFCFYALKVDVGDFEWFVSIIMSLRCCYF